MEENKNFAFNEKLDVETLEALYEDDLEYAADLFETFLDFTVEEFKPLKGLIEAEDWANTKGLAHKLKPTFSMVGLSSVESKMMEIEHLAMEQGNKQQILHLHQEVEQAIEEYVPILNTDLEKMKRIIGVA